jgi:hypothetical protein
MDKKYDWPEFYRRDFFAHSLLDAMMVLLGGVELRCKGAADAAAGLTKSPSAPPIHIGLIGLGVWGREILGTLDLFRQA